MWQQYLKIAEDDKLLLTSEKQLRNRGQEGVKEWAIMSQGGELRGTVSLRDKLTLRRSYSANYRLTQRDNAGRIVVDKLIDVL